MSAVQVVFVTLYAFLLAHLAAVYLLMTALASSLYPILDKNKYAHAFFSFVAALGLDLPKIWNALVRMLPGAPGATARAAVKLLPFVAIAMFGLSQEACLSNAPIVPVTAANQSAIMSCESYSNLHNGAVVGSLVSGALGTAAGAVAVADPNANVKNALGVTGASAAGVTAVGAGIIALTNQLYQNAGCSQFTGPLPILGKDGKPVARGFIQGDFAR